MPKKIIFFRILSFLIDFMIYYIIIMLFAILFGTVETEKIGFHVSGFPAFILMLIGILLWPVSEAFSGQTIGKRIVGLQVITDENKFISGSQAFTRFALGILDIFFLVGIIIALTNKKNKRIGDLVANTIVFLKS
jgi:uncharacterized RDD family membrane protein YckC